MSSSRHRRQAAVALALGLALAAPAARADGERVLAIGDIHGSLDGLTTILRETALTDDGGRWIGGRVRVVQTGDFTDRGDDVRPVIERLIELQREARSTRGEVIVLLGNHEMLNLMRHDPDVAVNPRIYASFADADSPRRLRQALAEWRAWRRQREDIAGLEPLPESGDEEWLARHPPGFIEYHEAMSAGGDYGRWLRRLPVVHRVDDTIFLHGGLSETFAQLSLERINELFREEIAALDQTRARLERKRIVLPFFTWEELIAELDARLANPERDRQRTMIREARERLDRVVTITGSPDSPLWFRGYANPPHGLADDQLTTLRDRLIEAYDAHRFVVAHSPFQGGDIGVRLGAFFLIDTGMLASVYAGRPSALEIRGDETAAIYPGQRQPLRGVAPSAAARPPARPQPALATSRPRFVLAATPARPRAAPPVFERPVRRWLDADGEPLPFATAEDVERFLSSARVISRQPIGEGKTGAERLELEHEGVRARGIFHDIDDRRDPSSAGGPVRLSRGSTMLRFRDSYSGQVAAYRLARLLGLDNVPPAVIREIEGVEGSLALWIEGGTNLTAWRQTHAGQPQSLYYQQQIHDMRVFDALANNKDRNTGNIFWTADDSVWLIDHTRTFAQDPVLYRPELVQRCSRELLAKIEALDEERALAGLRPLLSTFEVKAIFKRRQRLLRHLSERADKLGEERVFFDYGDPMGVVVIDRSEAGEV